MTAAELVAAIRAEHREEEWLPNQARYCECGRIWPCPPALAADRIEAALGQVDRSQGLYKIRAALDGDA